MGGRLRPCQLGAASSFGHDAVIRGLRPPLDALMPAKTGLF